VKIYSCNTTRKAINIQHLISAVGFLVCCSLSQAADNLPITLSAEEDHRRSLDLLGIDQLRPGVDGNRQGEPGGVNYDEALANTYPRLPDPLLLNNRNKVTDADTWWQQRRPETIEMFDREMYGRTPANLPGVTWEIEQQTNVTIAGLDAVKHTLTGKVDNTAYPAIEINIKAILVLPRQSNEPVPVMVQLIIEPFMTRYQEMAQEPGSWQSLLLEKGWGYAYLDTYTVQEDSGAGFTRGIIGLVNHGQARNLDDWGVLKAWGWGASRLLDYFETSPAVDATRVGIEGHSRWGKAALVTMAYDQRFAIGYISSSGSGGAKLHRRNFGEIVENNAGTSAYHWMGINYLKYAGPLSWDDLPVDAHQLIALSAPRPLFIGAGHEGDFWVDPKGMFLAAANAQPVYALLGAKTMETMDFPPLENGLMEGEIAFRQHAQGHTDRPNWPAFIEYAARYLDKP